MSIVIAALEWPSISRTGRFPLSRPGHSAIRCVKSAWMLAPRAASRPHIKRFGAGPKVLINLAPRHRYVVRAS